MSNDTLPYIQEFEKATMHFLPRFLLAAVVLVIFWLLARFIRNYSLKTKRSLRKGHENLSQAVSVVLYIFIFFTGIYFALEILGLEGYVTKMLAGAGIVGIVAGFAFKDIASNLFAGMLVNIQKPFKVDDWVMLDSVYGQVNEIGWITTTIANISGQQVFVPNQLIYNNTFKNYSTYSKRRVILKSGVSYGDDLEKVKEVALDEINQIKAMLPAEPIDFYFTEIGGYSYNFEVRFWIGFVQQTDYLNAMSETIMRIKSRFEKENISIAYPVQTLDFGVKGGVNIFDKPLSMGVPPTHDK
jgi:small conductance mechanosensitive channel